MSDIPSSKKARAAEVLGIESIDLIRELQVSNSQVDLLDGIELPNLRELYVGSEDCGSLKDLNFLKACPNLKTLSVKNTQSLSGIEHLPKLLCLSMDDCPTDLTPIKSCQGLKNIEIRSSLDTVVSVEVDLELFSHCHSLRKIYFGWNVKGYNWRALQDLKYLYSVSLSLPENLSSQVDEFGSWVKTIFKREPQLASKSLREVKTELEIVSQNDFDYYDSDAHFGIDDQWSGDKVELEAQRSLLCNALESYFSKYEGKGSYGEFPPIYLPWNGVGFSTTLVLYNKEIEDDFKACITDIQIILSKLPDKWLLYVQSDDAEDDFVYFESWISSDAMQCTIEYQETIENLLSTR